jgi:hypothetical protein
VREHAHTCHVKLTPASLVRPNIRGRIVSLQQWVSNPFLLTWRISPELITSGLQAITWGMSRLASYTVIRIVTLKTNVTGIMLQYFVQLGCSYISGVASFRIPWGLQVLQSTCRVITHADVLIIDDPSHYPVGRHASLVGIVSSISGLTLLTHVPPCLALNLLDGSWFACSPRSGSCERF